jgi:hypothetical protein
MLILLAGRAGRVQVCWRTEAAAREMLASCVIAFRFIILQVVNATEPLAACSLSGEMAGKSERIVPAWNR